MKTIPRLKWWNRALASLYFPNFCFITFLNVCVRSFTEHFRRNLSVAYLDTPELSPALDKFLTFVTKWAKECKLI